MPDPPKPTSRVVNFRKPSECHWQLGVVAKRAYLVRGERCVLAPSRRSRGGR